MAKLPRSIEITMMKPRRDAAPLTLWVRREGDQLSTYGVREDGKLATWHETVEGDAVIERWHALIDEQRRDGYHPVNKDVTGVLALLRDVERMHNRRLQIVLSQGRSHVDVTDVCEAWATGTGPQRTLVTRLLECHLDRPAPVAELVAEAHTWVGTAEEQTIVDVGRLRVTSPLLAKLAHADRAESTRAPKGFGMRMRLDQPCAKWLTIAFTPS